jgi:hypothetical protein
MYRGRGEMQRFARWVLGYHGCTKELAAKLIGGELAVDAWRPSENPHDWLGRGIYFWEHGPERAATWARKRHGDDAAVVGAIIQLGRCFDLLDVQFTRLLLPTYESQQREAVSSGKPLPSNRGPDQDLGGRYLDCHVINRCLQLWEGDELEFQTVRGAFWEGPPAFPGAKIMSESHIQIAVRDPGCILGLFRPA